MNWAHAKCTRFMVVARLPKHICEIITALLGLFDMLALHETFALFDIIAPSPIDSIYETEGDCCNLTN